MTTNSDDFLRLLRAGALFWSSYFLLLAVLDGIQAAPESLSAAYFVFYGASILAVLAIAFAPGLPRRLGKTYPPLLLVLMGFLPLLGETFILPRAGVEPWMTVLASSDLYIRQWAPTILVVALIAYGYARFQVLLFVGAITLFNLLLALLHPSPHARNVSLVISILFGVATAILAVGLNRAFQYLHRQQAALRDANRQLLELAATAEDLAISRERNRMARDLHDTLAHSLAGLIIQLDTVDAYWDEDPAIARDLLVQAVGTARSGLDETRRALGALRASPLEDMGLLLAVKDLAESAAQWGSLKLHLKLPQQLPQLSDDTEQCIYRVAQEATANVVHHANACHLDLWLSQINGRIILHVHDDGVGFDPAAVAHPGHYGLPGMVERARMAGGTLTVRTVPGQGAEICLDLPIHAR